jgi:hypothetical protein
MQQKQQLLQTKWRERHRTHSAAQVRKVIRRKNKRVLNKIKSRETNINEDLIKKCTDNLMKKNDEETTEYIGEILGHCDKSIRDSITESLLKIKKQHNNHNSKLASMLNSKTTDPNIDDYLKDTIDGKKRMKNRKLASSSKEYSSDKTQRKKAKMKEQNY